MSTSPIARPRCIRCTALADVRLATTPTEPGKPVCSKHSDSESRALALQGAIVLHIPIPRRARRAG